MIVLLVMYLHKFNPKSRTTCSSEIHMHDDITWVEAHLLMVSPNNPCHRKHIGFAYLEVDFLLQNLHNGAWSYEFPGIAQL